MNKRMEAWVRAENLVNPIVDKHGVEPYSIGQLFNQTTKITEVDQHIDSILRVADWLMEDDQ